MVTVIEKKIKRNLRKRRKNNSRKMRENPKRVQKDNGGPLQIKDKDTNINIDVIWKQNVFNHWTQIILAPFFVTHNRFHLIDVTVAQKET